jgi:hypothetical protein
MLMPKLFKHVNFYLILNIPQNCKVISTNDEPDMNKNDPDLVQEFLKKWWVESDLSLIFKIVFP